MIVIKNVRLINGTGKEVFPKTDILIENGKILAAGENITIPEGASVIAGEGLTAIPGLIDMHTHFGGSSTFDRPSCGSRFETYDYVKAREGFLRWGVTTVRTCGDQAEDIISFRNDVKAGKIQAPDVVCCGPFIQVRDGHPWGTVYFKDETIAEKAVVFVDEDAPIEEQVDRIAAMGVDFIKVFYGHVNALDYPGSAPCMTEEQLKRVVESAHRNGLKCACHVDGPTEMLAAAKAGADTIEHMVNAGNVENIEYTEELICTLKENGTVVDPTLIATCRAQTPQMKDVCGPAKTGVKKCFEAGIPLAVGCDSGIPFVPFGESLHDEMKVLVEAGIPAADVLRMATLGNAQTLGMADSIGSIEEGKNADIVLLRDDPLTDIDATKSIALVMKKGRIVYHE